MTTLTAAKPPVAAPVPPARRVISWERAALAVLLLGTAIAYLANLSANGWANSFYSAAVQAGSQSWEAFFFGSSDAANSITVDKPPASLWLMELSVRVFGLNSWSILVPEVLLGVGSVALVWATVRRQFGPAAGLLAGLTLAATPVAALMFRFNNPDALLVFLMVAAAWAMTRAVEDGRTRWLVLTGAFIGFGFLTKQLQVLLVVPALALTYLVAGPPALGKRVAQLLAAGAAMIVAAGWWLLAVELWPADSRPWIGGSQHNSILELTLGYNGLGRLNGEETGSVGPGGELPSGGNGMWGSTGITRLFEPAQGGQIAWLIPAALIGLVMGILLRGRASRTDPRRAALILWGGWLLVTGLVFSFMAGIFHAYYTVALAPAVAALVGASAVALWRERGRPWARVALAAMVAVTTATAWMLLSRSANFVPWLRWAVLVGGIVSTVAMLLPTPRKVGPVAALVAVLVGLAGPVAYSVDTVATAHQGSMPTAGPSVGGMHGRGPMGGEGRPGMGGALGGTRTGADGQNRADGRNGAVPGTNAAPGADSSGTSTAPGTNGSGADAAPGTNGPGTSTAPGTNGPGTGGGPDTNGPGAGTAPDANGSGTDGGPSANTGADGGAGAAPGGDGASGSNNAPATDGTLGAAQSSETGQGGPGGMGGLLGSSTPGAQVVALLESDGDKYTWVAAAIGSNSAAGYQLATELPVMPVGGFNGSDPSPTLEQFQRYVAEGRIHYFIGGGRGGPGGSESGSAAITAWVEQNFTATVVDGVTLYDLTAR